MSRSDAGVKAVECTLTDHPLTEDFHKDGCMALGLFTSKSLTQNHTLANLAGPEREHEIVHGAKVLEVTVVSAVLLRWLMARPVSLERLGSLVSFCFIIPKTVVAESPGAAVSATVVAVCSVCLVT